MRNDQWIFRDFEEQTPDSSDQDNDSESGRSLSRDGGTESSSEPTDNEFESDSSDGEDSWHTSDHEFIVSDTDSEPEADYTLDDEEESDKCNVSEDEISATFTDSLLSEFRKAASPL